MASSPITSWQIEGGKVGIVTDFIFLDSKITVGGDFSHEIKRSLLLERKAMTNLDNILKSRDIILLTKVHLVKAMVFPVVMYGCESWTIKKAEVQRIDAFELWCWRRLLRVPWTARRSNQSILEEISHECSLQELMLKLKLLTLATWCEELSQLKRPWCWERLKAGEGDGRSEIVERKDGIDEIVMASLTQWTCVWAGSGRRWGQGGQVCCSPWDLKESDMTEWQNSNDNNINYEAATQSSLETTTSFLLDITVLMSTALCFFWLFLSHPHNENAN